MDGLDVIENRVELFGMGPFINDVTLRGVRVRGRWVVLEKRTFCMKKRDERGLVGSGSGWFSVTL